MKNLLVFIAILAAATVRADKVDDLVKHAMDVNHIPGLALTVLKDGKPIKTAAYGLASIEFDVPVKPNTKFLLASITKSFTATSILILVREGKIRLDDPVSTYIDDCPATWKDITVRELLTHTAGLKDRFEETTLPWQWKTDYSKTAMLESAKKTPLDYKPGSTFQYSDQGYFLLGMIVEKASGSTYPQFLKEHIFDPLGMADSSTINLIQIQRGLASGYSKFGANLRHNHRRMEFGMVSHFGIVSTVEDLAKWDAALYTDKILDQKTLSQMWTPGALADGTQPYPSAWGSYGFGWFLDTFNGHRSVGHGGATGTAILRYPDDKLTIVVLTNLEQIDGGDAPGIAKDIAKIYQPELQWSAFKPKHDDNPKDAASLKAAFEGLAQGQADEKLFTAKFLADVKPSLPQQKAGLTQLGPIEEITLLEAIPWGSGRVNRYHVKFKNAKLYATAWFDSKGLIGYLTAEGGESY